MSVENKPNLESRFGIGVMKLGALGFVMSFLTQPGLKDIMPDLITASQDASDVTTVTSSYVILLGAALNVHGKIRDIENRSDN